ncbi:hypothetical protein EAE96_010875 [Botrytis aclada]|nr:hypothetical protein EAE96_010875 [Botrytis aclada]
MARANQQNLRYSLIEQWEQWAWKHRILNSAQVFATTIKMSYPDYLNDMESQLASYLGEDPSTFSSNENPTVSAPVGSLEESSYDANGRFTWDYFLREEGIETNSPPPEIWEWNPTQADFDRVEILPPPTANGSTSSEEPAQSSEQEEETRTNIESDNTSVPSMATSSQPEPQPEENLDIADTDSLFGGDTFNTNELSAPNNANHFNDEITTPSEQPPKISKPEQEDNIYIPDDGSLFGGSASDDVEVPNFNEEHQSETTAQEANSTPELVANTLHSDDNVTIVPITPGADLNNADADNDDDSLFGDVDDADLQAAVAAQAVVNPLNDAPTNDVNDLFGSEFGADFEAELDAEVTKNSTNAVAPAVLKHTGLHLPKPPRKVTKSQGLHLPDPPRVIANPQGLHLPEPPRANPQALNLSAPAPPAVANLQGLHPPSSPAATVTQQIGANRSATEQTGNQEDEASTRRRRVRASRIPRSDMSRPKGRGRAGKVLTQLSGPALSKLPEVASNSSSGADDTAEKATRLPRWAFGKYTSFGKPVAGSRYRKPNNSAQNPIPVDGEQESVKNTNELANTQSRDTAQPDKRIVGAIDLTSDTEDELVVEDSARQSQDSTGNDGQDSTRPHENLQIPALESEMPLTYGDDQFLNSPDELIFPPVMNNAGPAPEQQTYQSHSSAALEIVPPVAPQDAVSPPIMEDFSLYGQAPLASSGTDCPMQLPNVHDTGTFVHHSPYLMRQGGAQNYEPIVQPMQNGNYEAEIENSLGNNMAQDTSAVNGGSNSSGQNGSRSKKRPSNERADFGDPRVLMTYDEFKQIFPQEQTRGCFEVAIQNELAADAAILARGGVPQQRTTIRKSIICTWDQVEHLNRLRTISGEKLFEPKPNAHKRPQAFKEGLRRRRRESGEVSESEESDIEPEPKRLRLAQGPMQMAPSPGEHYGERSSQIRPVRPNNPPGSAHVSRPPNYGELQRPVSQGRSGIPVPQIHQPVPQSFKRKMGPEQWECFESLEREMRPTTKRPRIDAPLSENTKPVDNPPLSETTKPIDNQSVARNFQAYVSERQSEYLKLRVPQLKKLCQTREVKHDSSNSLTKGGLVGLLVGQDVSRHPVYSQIGNQAQARAATGRQHPILRGVGATGGMNPPPKAVNCVQQQPRAPDGSENRPGLPRSNVSGVHAMRPNYYQPIPSAFPRWPAPMGSRKIQPPVTNSGLNRGPCHGHSRPFGVGHVQQPSATGNSSGMANNRGPSLASNRHAYQGPMTQPSGAASYAQSRLPVSARHNGYNNNGIQHTVNGGRSSHAGPNTQIPAHGIMPGFGNGIYQPAVDDRRRKPRIQGQNAASSVPRGAQRSTPQPVVNKTGVGATGSQQPLVDDTSGHAHGVHPKNPADTLGSSQIPRPAPRGNMVGESRRFIPYSQGISQGGHQQHGAAQSSRPPRPGQAPSAPSNRRYFGPP